MENAGLLNGYSADDITKAFQDAVEKEIEINQKNGLPVAQYDAESKTAYIKFADGTKEFIEHE